MPLLCSGPSAQVQEKVLVSRLATAGALVQPILSSTSKGMQGGAVEQAAVDRLTALAF